MKLYLMHIKTEAVLPLGMYLHLAEFRDKGKMLSVICIQGGARMAI